MEASRKHELDAWNVELKRLGTLPEGYRVELRYAPRFQDSDAQPTYILMTTFQAYGQSSIVADAWDKLEPQAKGDLLDIWIREHIETIKRLAVGERSDAND